MAPRRDRVCALFTALLVLSGLLAIAPSAPAAGSQTERDACPARGEVVPTGRLARAVERGCMTQGRIVEDHGARALVPPKGYGVYAEAITPDGTQELSIETTSSGVVRLSDLGDDALEQSSEMVLREEQVSEEADALGTAVVANDTPVTALPIPDLPFTTDSTTVGAASEEGEPPCEGPVPYSTRWFRYEPSDARRLSAVVVSDHAVAVDVFKDDAGVLTPVACERSGTGFSRAIFATAPGAGYLLRVGSVSPDEQGSFGLDLFVAAPHDTFSDALKSAPLPYVSTTSSELPLRALEADEPQPGCKDVRSTLWYRYRPSATKTIRASASHVDGSGAVLGVYRGTSLGNLARVGCAAEEKPLRFRAEADRTYMFQVGLTPEAPPVGSLKLKLDGGAPPANDSFADASAIRSLPYDRDVGIGYATVQKGEPRAGCSDAVGTAWFRFRPSHNGHYKTSASSAQDRFVAVYRGDRMDSLRKIGCTSGSLSFKGRRGTTYHLQIGRGSAALADAKLTMKETIGPSETCASCAPPCADTASNLLGYRQETRFVWKMNLQTVPRGLDRNGVLSAIKRGFTNVTGARNDCGIPDDVSASSAFGGTTGKRATACYDGPDGVNTLDFGPLEPGPIGLACAWWRVRSGVDKLIESDVRLLPGDFWTLSPARLAADCRYEVDVESVITHEAGHVFGLGHVKGEHRNLTMHWSPNFCTAAGRTLGLGDLRGLRSRY